ncbi:MAG: response regulator transcription factor [Bacteroidales bacterium]|nr:response regulator transcription factor [Bacteroidales bacterium]
MDTKVIIVDDHPLFRMGLKAILGGSPSVSVVGEAETGNELFTLLGSVMPDIVLLDIVLPDISGVEISRRLREMYPDLRILIMSSETSLGTIETLVELGINGFIAKSEPSARLEQAIEAVMCGLTYFGQDVAKIIQGVSIANSLDPSGLSATEQDVVALCSKGLTAKEIAAKLGIGPEMVNRCKDAICQRLGMSSNLDLIRFAVKTGLVAI